MADLFVVVLGEKTYLTHRLVDCADTEEILILWLIPRSHHLSKPLNLR
jgi:hypothetical protein